MVARLSFVGIKLLPGLAHREIGIRLSSSEMGDAARVWRHRTGEITLDRTRVMGILNDVSGMREAAMVQVVAGSRAGAVVMHMLGNPKTMQTRPQYDDVLREVSSFLVERIRALEAAGAATEAIAVDPGVGFGKTREHNIALLRNLDRIVALGHPVVVGVSRKSFIEQLGGGESGERLFGSIAAASLAVAKGAHIVRVHDVRETVRAIRVADAISRGEKL